MRLDARTRRKFFEKYARVNAFDPLDPVGWYAQPIESILATKVIIETRNQKRKKENENKEIILKF